jgi:hypothetical protein
VRAVEQVVRRVDLVNVGVRLGSEWMAMPTKSGRQAAPAPAPRARRQRMVNGV